MSVKRAAGVAFLVAFIGSIVGANATLKAFGIIPIGFGLNAPAGVFFAGLVFTFRDGIHETLGRKLVLVAIGIGALLSWFLEPSFAIASGAAFFLSELTDFAVYTPLRKRGWTKAVVASNLVGLSVDSALFLWLAFGSLAFWEGLIVGKLYMTAIAIALIWLIRRCNDLAVWSRA